QHVGYILSILTTTAVRQQPDSRRMIRTAADHRKINFVRGCYQLDRFQNRKRRTGHQTGDAIAHPDSSLPRNEVLVCFDASYIRAFCSTLDMAINPQGSS